MHPSDRGRYTSIYHGASDAFLAPTDDIPAGSEEWGVDFASEIAVVTVAVPERRRRRLVRTSPSSCCATTYRYAISSRRSWRGFGFVQSKPSSAFSPFAV